MADISASKVMELRQRTGLGMMECKKALTEAGGDMAKAEDLLRIKSGAKASKAADRIAAEGVIGLWVAPDAKTGAMVEVNCETDFVARNDDFKAFAAEVAQVVARDNPADVAALGERKLASGDTVEARRVALVQKIGENMSIRRFVRTRGEGRARVLRARREDRRAGRRRRRRRAGRQGRRDARRGGRCAGAHPPVAFRATTCRPT